MSELSLSKLNNWKNNLYKLSLPEVITINTFTMIKEKIKAPILNSRNDLHENLIAQLQEACKKIAPLWPLENFVAVNPYLGLTHKKFENVAQDLATAGGIQMTLPKTFYLDKLQEGKIKIQDIATVLERKYIDQHVDADEFIEKIKKTSEDCSKVETIKSVADVASQLTEKDWSRFVTSRISVWAASYFDNGQAIWAATAKEASPFLAWKAEAEVDYTPEIAGLKNFRDKVKALPDNPLESVQIGLKKLDVPDQVVQLYLHSLLLRVGGWSAYVARLDWDNELYGGKGEKLIELLAVLVSWESCLLDCVKYPKLLAGWKEAKSAMLDLNVKKEIHEELAQKLILQEAFDLSVQRAIIDKFKSAKSLDSDKVAQANVQAIFCIDVRSEIFRRNLEQVDQNIETLGFAGFFAFPIKYVPIGYENGAAQCPVLLKTGPVIREVIPDKMINQQAQENRTLNFLLQQAWKSFKSGAVTCFSFVSPLGLSYLPKLFTDSFGLTRPVPHPDKAGLKNKINKARTIRLDIASDELGMSGISDDQRVQMARNALKAMSLTDKFAKLVLIVGHGSTSVNNPHATGLDCGACGGHSGEANARVAAAVLNDRNVRNHLKEDGIHIPESTLFLACLHDTTTDELHILNEIEIPQARQGELDQLKRSLAMAGQSSRLERSLRMGIERNIDRAIATRSKDWSQVRPEWGLAGCSTFVVAPRTRTRGVNFEGRSFLHSYEWKEDKDFSVLELIMTAPMVVTSWISLQYYGSTVDNKNFGSGNKTLHNVTAGIGVLEGYSGDLRVGLPMQSVHDGKNYQHEPLRLNVIIEAPIEAMNDILKKHSSVRDLCDNGWLHLLAMSEDGSVSHRYAGNLNWQEI